MAVEEGRHPSKGRDAYKEKGVVQTSLEGSPEGCYCMLCLRYKFSLPNIASQLRLKAQVFAEVTGE